MEFFNSKKFIIILICIIICASLVSCGFVPRVSCGIDDKADSLEEVGESCVQRPEFGITKEF